MRILKRILFDLAYIFINYFVAYIPAWWIRKLFYRLFGMKIGRGSRIYMKCTIIAPWGITIGNDTVVNEFALLDGRGGLSIGNCCSISVYSILYTASHHVNSETFEYYKQPTTLKDGVWIGARAIVMAGTVLENNTVIGANSTTAASDKYSAGGVYVGTPAEYKFQRTPENIHFKSEAFFR